MTPFQSRAWLLPLFETLGRDMKVAPLFITVRNASGAPALFLPLCRQRHLGAHILQFPDFGVSDYNAPLMSREMTISRAEAPAVLRAIVAALGSASALRLEKMPAQIDGIDNPLMEFSGVQPILSASWGFGLPPKLADYDKSLSSTFRKEIHRKRRRVAGRGEMSFVQAGSIDEKLSLFDTLVRQRQARCDEMGRFHLLSDHRFRAFYEAIIKRESTQDFVELHALKVNDEVVAATLSLRHRQSRFMLMTTFEGGDWKSCSLGNVVLYESIADSIARGDAYFDLTIGNESYKKDFGAVAKPLHSVTRALTIMGLPHAAVRTAAIAVRKRIAAYG